MRTSSSSSLWSEAGHSVVQGRLVGFIGSQPKVQERLRLTSSLISGALFCRSCNPRLLLRRRYRRALMALSESFESEQDILKQPKRPLLRRLLAVFGLSCWDSVTYSAHAEEAVAISAGAKLSAPVVVVPTATVEEAMAAAAPLVVPTATAEVVTIPIREVVAVAASMQIEEPKTAEEEEEENILEEVAQEVPIPESVLPTSLPQAPGMESKNLVVEVSIDPQFVEPNSQRAGADHLMKQSSSTILGRMARDGWEVIPLDESKGIFEVILPAVKYEMPLGTVSIPAPHFLCTVYNSTAQDDDYQERLIGDLVLQNGQDLLNVDLRFFSHFSISASGWARCNVGREGDSVRFSSRVQVGMQVPKVPGLTSIMEFFVKTYASQSTNDCCRALAKGSDELSSDRSE